MAADKDKLPSKATSAEVDDFLRRLAAAPQARPSGQGGRLIFAMDATASREPTWDRACRIQGEMFEATSLLGGLEVQLVFYRGFGECRASPWLGRAADLLKRMSSVSCLGGQTQIGRVLRHVLTENGKRRVNAVVFVGDCMEESADELCDLAGRIGVLGLPVFLFHEGSEPRAARTFRDIARLTRGAYCRFDSSSAQQLRDLLSAVAVYAAGGLPAREDYGKRAGGVALQLTHQMAKE